MDFPDISPIIYQFPTMDIFGYEFAPALRWYGLMYLLGFVAAWWLGNLRAKRQDLAASNGGWTSEQVSDFLFYCFLGVILGGRIGYVVFYHMDLWLKDFMYLFKIHEGGMSFHGGLIGVALGSLYFAYKTKKSFFEVADFVAPLAPLGLFFGRIGNFINGELWGREASADFFLGIRFPTDDKGLLRHPSQLYEALSEGLLLFIILWIFTSKPRPRKAASGIFLLGYGASRFVVEYFREPDSHLADVSEIITRGQVLCLPMILIGGYLLFSAYKNVSNAKQPNLKGKSA